MGKYNQKKSGVEILISNKEISEEGVSLKQRKLLQNNEEVSKNRASKSTELCGVISAALEPIWELTRYAEPWAPSRPY